MAINSGKIVVATQAHIDALKGNLRESDKRELWDSIRMKPDEGVQMSFDVSKFCWVATVQDKPILCFGAASLCLLSSVGSPWMLASNDFKRVHREFIRGCKVCVKTMLSFFDRLENMVDVRNTLNIRWLQWCGFSIGPKVRYGPNNLLFYKFFMDKED